MPEFNDTELAAAVIRSFEETPDLRVKFLMEELVKSLLVRKTGLTFDEWGCAIDFLTRTGQMFVQSRVRDLRGKPLAGARVDVWYADGEGYCDLQKPPEKHKPRQLLNSCASHKN